MTQDAGSDAGKAAEVTYATIRRQILSGERAGGEWLREGDLAAVIGVSRTPVREALRRLAAEGLVRHEPNRGVQVEDWGVGDLDEIFSLRSAARAVGVRPRRDHRPGRPRHARSAGRPDGRGGATRPARPRRDHRAQQRVPPHRARGVRQRAPGRDGVVGGGGAAGVAHVLALLARGDATEPGAPPRDRAGPRRGRRRVGRVGDAVPRAGRLGEPPAGAPGGAPGRSQPRIGPPARP